MAGQPIPEPAHDRSPELVTEVKRIRKELRRLRIQVEIAQCAVIVIALVIVASFWVWCVHFPTYFQALLEAMKDTYITP
jgi:hypothetical protein